MTPSPQTSSSGEPRKSSSGAQREPTDEPLPMRAARVTQRRADQALEYIEALLARSHERFDEQRDLAAGTLERLSNALGFVEADAESERVARYLGRAGEQVRSAADYVSTATPRRLTEDVSRLARERTGVALGGFFLAGMALGRFLRASQNPPEKEAGQ